MADGSRSAENIGAVEHAARILAAGNGTGAFLRCATLEVGAVENETRGDVVGIAWRGMREESAARSIENGTRAAAMHAWTRSGGTMALPSYRADTDALAALAGVEMVLGELLRVYALQEWHRWPLVERAALVCVTGRGSREAVCDAMGRVLWRVAAVSQDERAKLLRMRAADYRALTRKAEGLLSRWLDRGARQFLAAMKGTGAPQHRTGSDLCGLRRVTWWSEAEAKRTRDGFLPVKRHE